VTQYKKDKVPSVGSKISPSPDIGLDIIYSEHPSGRVKDRLQARWLWARVEQTVTKLDPLCMNTVLRLQYTLQLQRVCRQPVNVEGWIHSQGSPCGVFGELRGTMTWFSRVFPLSCKYSFTTYSFIFLWGTALQAGRSRVRIPMVSLEFFIDIILRVAQWPWGWLSL